MKKTGTYTLQCRALYGILALFLVLFPSCSGDTEEEAGGEEATESTVSYTELQGTWKLAEWNGASLADGLYCYITFASAERTFVLYQNFDSMYSRRITGTFYLNTDYKVGTIIDGTYDYQQGDWNQSYLITHYSTGGSMVWTSREYSSDVQRFERCSAVPQSIVDEALGN